MPKKKRDLPTHVIERKLPSGKVAFQFERRLLVRRRTDGLKICQRQFRRSLGTDREDVERRVLLAAAEYEELRQRLEEEARRSETYEQEPGTMTVATFAHDRYFPDVIAPRNQKRNFRDQWARFVNYVNPVIGDMMLRDVKRRHVSDVRAFAESSHLSPRSVLKVMQICGGLLRWAEVEEEIGRSPFFHEIHLPKPKQGIPRPLNPAQVKALLDHFKGKGWKCTYLLLGLTSGMRKAEIQSIRWSDIDWDANRLRVEGKGGKERTIPLFAPLRKVLTDWRRDVNEQKVRSVFVIPTRGDNFNWVDRSWDALGFRWSLHRTRHTFACAYLDRGGRVEVLAELLGHASPETTRIYARVANKAVAQESLRVLASMGFLDSDAHFDAHTGTDAD